MIALAATLGLVASGLFSVMWRFRERIRQLEHERDNLAQQRDNLLKERDNLAQERDNLALWVEDAKQRDYVDQKTGIPNEKKMEEDIFLFCKEVEEKKIPKFCIIQIDLENFDQVNTLTSSRKGDIAIRAFAQTVYRSMRRDEYMFRSASSQAYNTQSDGIFRRHVGGDEFIFLLKGPTHVALGFIQRLLQTLMPQYSREISSTLNLRTPVTLSLRAGVVEIGRKEVPEVGTREGARGYIDKAEELCNKAKNKDHNLRVFWPGVVEQAHSSEVSQTAAQLTLIDILARLRKAQAELKLIKDASPTSRREGEANQSEQINMLESDISRLKRDARFVLAFAYDQLPLAKEDRDYLYDLR
jgi:diguanylate cyclase (GGDEF)-like protein